MYVQYLCTYQIRVGTGNECLAKEQQQQSVGKGPCNFWEDPRDPCLPELFDRY